jgi:O-antigen biosynthesis protein
MNLSVIIINYNSFRLLNELLDSILTNISHQLFFEIIVIDNNSSEGNISDYIPNDPKIKIIKNSTNKGFSAANNQGIKIAKGEYILFLNNDTLFLEDTISRILEFIKQTGNNIIVGCRLLNEDGTHQTSVVDRDSLTNSFGENLFLYLIFKNVRALNRYYFAVNEPKLPEEVDIIKGAFIFCSKKIVDELNGFDERFFFYAEETDFCMRAKNKGYKIYYYPNTAIIHYGGAATDRNQWFKFKNQSIAKIQIYQKHSKGIEFFLFISSHYLGILLRVPVYLVFGLFSFNSSLIAKSFLYFRQLFIYPKNLFK